jgi:hypothetical protein
MTSSSSPVYKLSGCLLIATSVLTRLRSNVYYRLQISRCKLPLSTTPLIQSLAVTLLLSTSPPSLAMKSPLTKLLRVRLLFTRVVALSALTVDSVAGT